MAPQGGYHPSAGIIGDPTLPYRSTYPPPPRLFSGTSTTTLLQPPPPPPPPAAQQQPNAPPNYLYTSPSRLPSSYPPHHPSPPFNDYYVGHVLSGAGGSGTNTSQYPHHHHGHHHHGQNLNYMNAPPESSNYTCIGAPVGHGFNPSGSGSSSGAAGAGRDVTGVNIQEDVLTWGRTSYATQSSINRSYQDGF
ncbi:hypothetical protein ACFE04_016518 [Oxalis oulophora]